MTRVPHHQRQTTKPKHRNLDDATFAPANKIQVVEVIMEVLVAPLGMKM